MATTETADRATDESATLEAGVSKAVSALETAISTLHGQLDSAKRLAERLEQACSEGRDLAKLTEQTLLKLEADRSSGEALRVQLEAEIGRLHAALAEAKTEAERPWWQRRRGV